VEEGGKEKHTAARTTTRCGVDESKKLFTKLWEGRMKIFWLMGAMNIPSAILIDCTPLVRTSLNR
jgi:hypothetical protein